MASVSARRVYDTTLATLETDEQSARRIADLFAEGYAADQVAVSVADSGQGNWRVTFYFSFPVDRGTVSDLAAVTGGIVGPTLSFERVAAKDWVRESLAGLQPVQAGRFIVHGAHDRARVPGNRIGIEIEASLAFGTGHHGTTRGCLLALDRICNPRPRAPVHRHPEARAKRASTDAGRGFRAVTPAEIGLTRFRNSSAKSATADLVGSSPCAGHVRVTGHRPRILDLGTGSGVLAIAAARALRRRVLATDLDAEAVRVARANTGLNGVASLIEVAKADGVASQSVRARAPFDLVFANILLGPLQRLAAPLTKLTAPGARVILSGLLPSQANAALAAYRALALERRIELGGWTTLVLVRRTRPRRTVARRRRGS